MPTVIQAQDTITRSSTLIVSGTQGVGNYTTIGAAAAALPASGGLILVREGTYSFSTTATVPNKPVVIRGCGRGVTTISLGTNAIPAFTLTGGAGALVKFEDLTVTGTSVSGQTAVLTQAAVTVMFKNVDFNGLDKWVDNSGGFAVTTYTDSSSISAATGINNGSALAKQAFVSNSQLTFTTDAFLGFLFISASNSVISATGCRLQFAKGTVEGCVMAGNITCNATGVGGSYGVAFTACKLTAGSATFIDNNHSWNGSQISVGSGTVGVAIQGQNCVVSGSSYVGPGVFVIESGSADKNVYSSNFGFAGSTIIGTSSQVVTPTYSFAVSGALATGADDSIAWLPGLGGEIDTLRAFVKTAPVGSDIILTYVIGTISTATVTGTIDTLHIVDGTFSGSKATTPIFIRSDQFIGIQITQVGSGTAGSNLTAIAR